MNQGIETGRETRYYHLDLKRQTPGNSDLIQGIIKGLRGVSAQPLIADKFQGRVADTSLLAGVNPESRNFNGVIVGAVGRELHDNLYDVWSELETVTHPKSGVEGKVSIIFTYFAGRDDKLSKHWGGVLHLEQYLHDIQAHARRRNSAIAVWDVHSRETLKYLRWANGKRSAHPPEVVSLTAMPLFADRLKADGLLDGKETVVAAPDFGSFTKAREMAILLNKPLIFIDKHRPSPNHLIIKGIYMVNGDGNIQTLEKSYLRDKRVVFFDDMFDTGGTAVDLAYLLKLKSAGASEIVFAATHGVFSDRPKGKAKGEKTSSTLVKALNYGIIDYLYVSDSLPQYRKVQKDPGLLRKNRKRVRFISLAKPIAALINIAADTAVKEDYDLVRRCLYNPGPHKDRIEGHFQRGNVAPAYRNFDMQQAVYGNKSEVIFSRQPVVN